MTDNNKPRRRGGRPLRVAGCATRNLGVKVTEHEHAIIGVLASLAGVTVSDFIRALVVQAAQPAPAMAPPGAEILACAQPGDTITIKVALDGSVVASRTPSAIRAALVQGTATTAGDVAPKRPYIVESRAPHAAE